MRSERPSRAEQLAGATGACNTQPVEVHLMQMLVDRWQVVVASVAVMAVMLPYVARENGA